MSTSNREGEPVEPLMKEVYFGGGGLSRRGVARELNDGPYPLRDGLPLRLWEMDPLEDGTPDYIVEDAVAEYAEDRHQWTWRPIRGTFTRRSEAPPGHWSRRVDWADVERRSKELGPHWVASWRPVRQDLPETPLRCSQEEPAVGENLHLGSGRCRDAYHPDARPTHGVHVRLVTDPPDAPLRAPVECPWCRTSFLQGVGDVPPDKRPPLPR